MPVRSERSCPLFFCRVKLHITDVVKTLSDVCCEAFIPEDVDAASYKSCDTDIPSLKDRGVNPGEIAHTINRHTAIATNFLRLQLQCGSEAPIAAVQNGRHVFPGNCDVSFKDWFKFQEKTTFLSSNRQ